MELIQHIETLIAEPLESRDYLIVRVHLSGSKRRVLQIMIERKDEQPITVDDCASVSRLVSVLLDKSDLILEQYVLEVSSPGLDRPLVKFKDFERFQGCSAHVKTNHAIQGQKKFRGLIQNAVDNQVVLRLDAQTGESSFQELSIPFEDIQSAKLDIDFNGIKKKED